jgi:hypothetical protein
VNPTPPGSSGGFFARNLSRILVGALVGLLVGAFFALRSPPGYDATTEVLVTRLAAADLGENSLDGTTPLDAEIRFAQSGVVLDVVRGAIPTAPNTIDVEAGGDNNVLAFTAPGDTADEAIRLSRNWASAYVSQRRDALIATWTDRAALAESELELLITQLGTARLAGDDAEAARLETRRDVAATEEAAATSSIEALQSDPGAELFGDVPTATATGRSLIAMTILGTLLGAGITGAWLRWREQQADDEAEAESWLYQATEGSLDLVMTAGMLDIPAFLAPDAPPVEPAAPLVAPTPPQPVAAPVLAPAAEPAPALPALSTPVAPAQPAAVQQSAPAPAAAPAPVAAPTTPQPVEPVERPRLVPAAIAAPDTPQSVPAAAHSRTTLTVTKPAAQPLRIAKINPAGQAANGSVTRRPTLSRVDQAWADDISLTSDG